MSTTTTGAYRALCSKCLRGFPSPDALRMHRNAEHPARVPEWVKRAQAQRLPCKDLTGRAY